VTKPNSTVDRTVDHAEVAQFDSANWWGSHGPAHWLHKYNPVRVSYTRAASCRRFGRDPTHSNCLHGLRFLDIGCGGGVFCEPLAQLGAQVVGIDPAETAIKAAIQHAHQTGVQIDYRCTTAEALAGAGERFDVVLAMEVIEHAADTDVFIQHCARLVKPGGLAILSTLNRTFKSYAFAIAIGEYILRLLPRGTHQWHKFRTPDEIRLAMERSGLRVSNVTGVNMNLMTGTLQLSTDTSVNYLLTAELPASARPELLRCRISGPYSCAP
jgi:2-polyprenyl-6-hydroxyphenyl methylase / 3-demethylubiquinone-9 3-methyltransferase